jgi:glycosyltransferase involved in cell wall biosynthesis
LYLRILLADSGRAMRGGQWQTLYLARGLRQNKHDVRVLARAGGPLFETLRAGGFSVRPLNAVRLLVWSQWAEITHAHDARSHTLAALACSKPFVVSRRVAFAVHDTVFSKWKYWRPAKFVAVSDYVAHTLIHFGVPRRRIVTVYDGVPQPEQIPALDKRGIPVLALRTGDRMKGDDLIAEAAELAGIEVRWTASMDDLPNARVFVYVSRSEGLGSAALLAMAHGVAVVASRCGGLEEAIRHERSGLLVENRPADIAAALLRLQKDPALVARLAAAARAEAKRRFAIGRMVRQTIQVYRELAR